MSGSSSSVLRATIGLLAAAILTTAPGCYKATFINPAVVPGETHEEWTDFFLGGLVGSEEFDVREFCPGEAAKVATGGNFLTNFVTAITFGIYAPRKVYVTCATMAPPPTRPATRPATRPPAAPSSGVIPAAAVPVATATGHDPAQPAPGLPAPATSGGLP